VHTLAYDAGTVPGEVVVALGYGCASKYVPALISSAPISTKETIERRRAVVGTSRSPWYFYVELYRAQTGGKEE